MKAIASNIPNARLGSYTAAQATEGLRDLVTGFVLGDHAEAPATQPAAAAAADAAPLTPREIDVLRLIAGGRSNRQIADDLVISERTVVRHIANIYAKVGAHGRADATAYAFRHRMV
jgi:DNA-binding NarL/FixJ family response regulator